MEITLDSGDRFCYVPVLESLERLLNDEFILAEVKWHVFSVQTNLWLSVSLIFSSSVYIYVNVIARCSLGIIA